MIEVLNNQTLLDVVLQFTGAIENLFEVIRFNNLSELKINEGEILNIEKASNPKLVAYFQEKKITCASIDTTLISQLSNDFDDEDFDTYDFE